MTNKKLRTVTAVLFILATVMVFSSTSSAIAPLAARLIGINDTLVNIQNFPGGIRGITTDGVKVYARSSNYGNSRIYETNFDGSGTTYHDVTNPPANVNVEQSNLAMSHGCIWASTPSGDLYCIDTTTWSAHQIAVPAAYPLPTNQWWIYSNMTDLPDGRIARISAPTGSGSSYTSTLRTYTVTGTGATATIAWSEDFILADTQPWPSDDHGIASDGVYLYRISCCTSDYQSWSLVSGAPSPLVHSYTYSVEDGLGNSTFITHDHIGSRYIVGDYDNARFYYTDSQHPGSGPGVPTTTTPTTTAPTTTLPATTTTAPPMATTTTPTTSTTAAPPTTQLAVPPTPVVETTAAPVGQASIARIVSTTTLVATTPTKAAPTTSTTIPPTTTSTIPSISSVPVGEAAVLIDGSNAPTEVSRQGNKIIVAAGAMKATFSVLDDEGKNIPLDSEGNITASPNATVGIELEGFIPESQVEAWLFSTPTKLGAFTITANGSLTTSVPLPEGVDAGEHRISVVNQSAGKNKATFTLGITISQKSSSIDVPVWVLVIPLILAVFTAMFLPPALRRKRQVLQ